MMKQYFLLIFLLLAQITAGQGQEVFRITEKGAALKQFYLSLNVEHLWLKGRHINWETGEQDSLSDAKHAIKTHCSAFVAAACKQKNIYILRPPEHGQVLLANAQFDWLRSGDAHAEGWRQVTDSSILATYCGAQQYANEGAIVVAVYKNNIPKKPGHIALVMPAETTKEAIAASGPVCISAGRNNSSNVPLKDCFKSHISRWPEPGIAFYYNDRR